MYILSAKNLLPSSRLLAKELRARGLDISLSSKPLPEEVAIRWGNSEEALGNSDTLLNDRELIWIAGNKLRFSQHMTGKDIVHVEIHTGQPEHYPVVVRQELSRGGGMGIVVCQNDDEFLPHRFRAWSYWVNFQYELGVHVLGGEITRVFKKVWEGDEKEPEFPIRNTSRGYHFKLRNPEKYSKLGPYVEEIIREFPLEFCRMDIGWNPRERRYEVIEINTAPDLTQNSNTLKVYADFLFNCLK